MKTRSSLLLVLALVLGLVPQATARAAVRKDSKDKVTDTQITQRIEQALQGNPLLENSVITVTTNAGTVRLTGDVRDLAARQAAENIVEKIDGVRSLTNEIKVTPAARRDKEIMQDIERRFQVSPELQSKDVNVAVNNAIVTLTGTVKNRVDAQEAEFLAGGVIGVRSVTNELRAMPMAERSDAEIASDALSALDRDAYLQGLPLEVDVQNGVINLSGTVGTLAQEQRAVTHVMSVPGIKGVKVKLTVDPNTMPKKVESERTPSDADIQKSVTAALMQDPRIDASNVTISVSDGEVTLTGYVPTDYQSIIAKRDVHEVVHVVRLKDKLMVRGPSSRPDESIKSDVQALLDTDALLGPSKVNVSVNNGVVRLSGKVAGQFEKMYAQNLAARPLGVTRVVDKLDVKNSSTNNSDQQLQRLVEDRLSWDWVTSWVEPQIQVQVYDGVAILTGDVNTWSQRLEAARVALSVPGVREVNDNLSVLGEFTSQDYYYPGDFLFDPWSQLFGPSIWP